MTTPKITTLEELRKVSQGSPLGLIIESLINRNFVPANQEPLTEKDQQIGTLNQAEKAIFNTVTNLKNTVPEFSKKLYEIHQKVDVIDHQEDIAQTIEEKMDKLRKDVVYTRKVVQNLTAIFWGFIRKRLHNEGIFDTRHIIIKSHDSIVIPEKSTDKKSSGGTLVIKIGI